MTPEPLLTARQVAELLGFAPATVVDWYEAGKLPGFKIGGRLRFRPSEVEAWLEAKRAGAGGEAPTTPRIRPPRGVVSRTPTTPLRGGDHA
jgi:excisionase family DNA binding protein